MDVQSRIREVLSTSLQSERRAEARAFGEAELLGLLREQGVVEDVMERLRFGGGAGSSGTPGPQGGASPKDPRPATHHADGQDKLMGVPLKKGQ